MAKIRLADYVMQTLAECNFDTAFMLTGGMAMHLNDALAGETRIKKICCHHEQACSLAAEGYAHITGKPALVQVTAGPGAINAMTGVFSAYVDGLPMLIISGQPKTETLTSVNGVTGYLRQGGEQEADIPNMVKSITKYAVTIHKPDSIRYELEKALYLCQHKRKGPVWLEIPLDIQGTYIEPDTLPAFHIPLCPKADMTEPAKFVFEGLCKAKRPLIVVGQGIRLYGALESFWELIENLQVPVACAGTLDTVYNKHPLFAGRIGSLGSRAGNINIQSADYVLYLGVSFHMCFTTYNWQAMAKNAYKVVIECDESELERPNYIANKTILGSSLEFIEALNRLSLGFDGTLHKKWLGFCKERLLLLPMVTEQMRSITPEGRINPYYFVEELNKRLKASDYVVPSNASSGLIIQQIGSLLEGQRMIANFGCGPMGYGLPAAIGVNMAAPDKRVICLEGDGSIMLNMQELATIKEHNLPIIIFIFNNLGYLSIKVTQDNFFKTPIGAGSNSGLFFPDFVKLAEAFAIPAVQLSGKDFPKALEQIMANNGPLLVDVLLDPDQAFEPKIASRKLDDGTIVSSPPHDMSPFLPQDELRKHLLFDLE